MKKKTCLAFVFICILLLTYTFAACNITDSQEKDIFITNGEGVITGLTEYGATLAEIDVPLNIKGESISAIGESAFEKNENLTSINIPNGIETIENRAFIGCNNLTEIVIPNSVKHIGYGCLKECNNLSKVTIPFLGEKKDWKGEAKLGYIFGQYDNTNVPKRLEEIKLTNSTVISNEAFYYCANLKNIELSDGVDRIGYRAFEGCSNLTSLRVPDSVVEIGNAVFSDCVNLKDIILSKNINMIGDYAFRNCSSLESVDLPNNLTSIGEFAFSGCSKLTNFVIPDKVTNIGIGAFQGCSNLNKIVIPYNVKSIGKQAFYKCNNLNQIEFEHKVGWYYTFSYNSTVGYDIDVNDSNLNAVNMQGEYLYRYLKRNN